MVLVTNTTALEREYHNLVAMNCRYRDGINPHHEASLSRRYAASDDRWAAQLLTASWLKALGFPPESPDCTRATFDHWFTVRPTRTTSVLP